MPRGRPKKVQEVVKHEEEKRQPQAEVLTVEKPKEPEVKQERPAFRETPPMTTEEVIKQSRKALDEPLQIGQKFFEAPDGEIIVGDAEKNEVWSRRLNAWINPRR